MSDSIVVDAAPERAAASVPERASARKHRAILEAAEEMFLRGGYLGTNMDELAALSQVSKQTVYKHFGSKEALFVELVTTMTDAAGDRVHDEVPDPAAASDVAAYLRDYAERQLGVVMTPRLLQLRRLVIGEVARFPDLARALYERGPKRAMASLAAVFARLDERGLLRVDDPDAAASHFNWLVMGEPVNRAMLLGDAAIPSAEERRRHVAGAVRVFLAAYGRR
jgi:TetR/AcrR family transcriptional regulator, mexJK operon transcriptional repressor